jgi:hypothetical protein
MPNVLNLNDHKETEVLSVKIGDKTYSIPLGNHLKVKDYKKLKKVGNNEEEMFDFLAQYLGQDVVEDLTIADMTAIFTAWSEATQKASGLKPGES